MPPRIGATLPVVTPKDLRTSAGDTLRSLLDSMMPDLCKDAGVEYVPPPKDGEQDTTNNLTPRRRVELD
jgi:hypothetical protein